MTNQLYRKINGKYEKVGPCDGFFGFPTDGLWLVRIKPGSRSSECIKKIDEVPDPYPLASLIMHRDDIVKSIRNYCNNKQGDLIENGKTSFGAYELTNKILEDLENIIIGKDEDIINKLREVLDDKVELSKINKQMDSINKIISNLKKIIK